MTPEQQEILRLRRKVARLEAMIDVLLTRPVGDMGMAAYGQNNFGGVNPYNYYGGAGGADQFQYSGHATPVAIAMRREDIQCGWDADGENTKIVFMSERKVKKLPEYSTSLPTGTTIGKRWKADKNARRHPEDRTPKPDWMLAEYYDINDVNKVGIRWTKIIVVAESSPGQPAGTATPPGSGTLSDPLPS
jgi:hypothetical protein